MSTTVDGIIHGRTIELDRDLGLADGQRVQVTITEPSPPAENWGEGILRSAGAWADYPELDAIFEDIQRARKQERGTTRAP